MLGFCAARYMPGRVVYFGSRRRWKSDSVFTHIEGIRDVTWAVISQSSIEHSRRRSQRGRSSRLREQPTRSRCSSGGNRHNHWKDCRRRRRWQIPGEPCRRSDTDCFARIVSTILVAPTKDSSNAWGAWSPTERRNRWMSWRGGLWCPAKRD